MVDGKFVPGLAAHQASDIAFRKLLKARLQAVAMRCKALDRHAETVHQLRVSTRRASAALRLAREAISTKRHQRAGDLLRKLRRSAGSVRDIDIYLGSIQSAKAITDSTRAFLAGHMAYSRAVNFETLQEVVKSAMPELLKAIRSLPAVVETKDETLADVLTRNAKSLMRDFDDALLEAETSLDAEHLHRVRIQAKRLRYSLEILPDSKPAAVVAHVEKLQDILGFWHDVHAVNGRLVSAKFAAASVNGAAGSPVIKGIDSLTMQNERIEARQLAAYRRWLKAWFAFRKRHTAKSLFAGS